MKRYMVKSLVGYLAVLHPAGAAGRHPRGPPRGWWHAVLPGQLPPSDAVRRRAARRWAAQDRARGYRILPPDPPATGRPWANALPKE